MFSSSIFVLSVFIFTAPLVEIPDKIFKLSSNEICSGFLGKISFVHFVFSPVPIFWSHRMILFSPDHCSHLFVKMVSYQRKLAGEVIPLFGSYLITNSIFLQEKKTTGATFFCCLVSHNSLVSFARCFRNCISSYWKIFWGVFKFF